jgi:monoamine oxidase
MANVGHETSYLKSPFDYKLDDYKDILTNRTPLPKSQKERIAIIGAGMSGLIAGSLLKRAGHDVTIFEAKHTVGGRVKTLRERFTSGFYAEAGAMRIPRHHALTWWLVQDHFALPIMEFKNHSQNGLIYINNVRSTFANYDENPHILNFALSDTEKNKSANALFEECIETYVATNRNLIDQDAAFATFKTTALHAGGLGLTQDQFHALLKDFDQYSLRQFLTVIAKIDGNNLSQGAVDMICAIMGHEMQMSSSMAAVISQYSEFNAQSSGSEAKFIQIDGGMDKLPKAFLAGHFAQATQSTSTVNLPKLDENVRFNSRVIEINISHPGLQVTYQNTITSYERPEYFGRVIICIPFSALRHIRMYGLTTPQKRRAIRQLHYANACKILLEFSHKFWLEKMPGRDPIEGGRSITDLTVRQIFYPSLDQNKNILGSGLLLASYTWGDDSLRWTSLKPDDRIRFALRDLERVHANRGGLVRSCIGGMSHSWAEDEFTSGAFAQFEPHQLIWLFDDVWRPENRIHYAGEHTSTKHGWIEGAVESGIRVADEVCRSLSLQPRE